MENNFANQFSVVIPAYNEAKTVAQVVAEVLKLKSVSEVILVNDGSTDSTEAKLKKFTGNERFIYIRHKKNLGKGMALKHGLQKAHNQVVMFLDADLLNTTHHQIYKIAQPVLRGEVDLARAKFSRARGRVTEHAVKPMMRILFPKIDFEQPITGQICAKKEFLETLDMEKKYGVDIGILLDAIQAGQRIVEVDIGKLRHKANSEKNIAAMSQQVLETLIQKAGLIRHKYKLVIFALDETLIKSPALVGIYHKLGVGKRADELHGKFYRGEITFGKYMTELAATLKNQDPEKIAEIVNAAQLRTYAPEVVSALKKRRFEVAIISQNPSPIVLPLAQKLGINLVDCVYLESKNNRLTGKLSTASKERWISNRGEVKFSGAFRRMLQLAKVKATETIMVANSKRSIPLQNFAGLSIAYQPKDKILKEIADKTITVLAELLAIVE